MDIAGTFQTVIKSLRTNKLRSVLTLLGIIFGVATVITMMGITEGFRADSMTRISDLGTRNIIINFDFLKRKTSSSRLFTMEDLEAVRARNPFIDRVVPFIGSSAEVKYMEKTENLQLTGTTPDVRDLMGLTLDHGRLFDEEDIKKRATVCILGNRPKELLFGKENPVGKEITIRNKGQKLRFTVIGYFEEKTGWSGRDVNESIVMPYSTLRFRLLGTRDFRTFWARAKHYEMVEAANQRIVKILEDRGLPVFSWTPKENIEFQKDMFNKITLFGLCISGISLLIGGIGIMNIMLVSVMERIREIGIRRAVGAREKDILMQFLLEAMFVGCVGGMLGVPLGILGALSFAKMLKVEKAISEPSIFVAFFFASAISILFGYYPAKKAAEMDPVEALRYQ